MFAMSMAMAIGNVHMYYMYDDPGIAPTIHP